MTDSNPVKRAGPRLRDEPEASPPPPGTGSRVPTRPLLRALSVALTVLWVLAVARDWVFPGPADAVLARVEAELATHMPAYALLEQHDPEAHRRVSDAMRSAIARGETPAQVALAGGRTLGQVVDQYVPRTSGEAITGYADALLRSLRVIAQQDGVLCYDVLYRPSRVPQDRLGAMVPEALVSELVRAQGRVIEHALRAPFEDAPGERAEELMARVSLALERAYGADADRLWRAEPGHRQAGRERVCRMTISMFEVALAMQADERAIVLRHLLSP